MSWNPEKRSLSPELVRKFRRHDALRKKLLTRTQMAKLSGVSKHAIEDAISRKTYKDVR